MRDLSHDHVLGKRLDEIEDIGVPTSLFDLLLSDLALRLGRSKKNVETDGSSVERGLLRNECNCFTIFLHVQIRDFFTVEVDFSAKRIVETFNELDAEGMCQPTSTPRESDVQRALPRAARTNKRDICARLHL